MKGTPVFVSSPHFLYGDEYYMKQTEGLSPPNKEEHETALVFEPVSIRGTSFATKRRPS